MLHRRTPAAKMQNVAPGLKLSRLKNRDVVLAFQDRVPSRERSRSQWTGVVISSHRTDHIGSVDYKLANIRRDEPPVELFTVPPDYTFVRGSHDDPGMVLRQWLDRTG
jgi:hypothetical protein